MGDVKKKPFGVSLKNAIQEINAPTDKLFENKKGTLLAGILFFLAFLFQFFILRIVPLQERWQPCFDFLREGVLYGGQPICVNGPFTYLILTPIDTLGGELAQLLTHIVNYLFYALLFYLLWKILKREERPFSFILLAVFFVFLVILPIYADSDALYATLFFVLGFYTFLYLKLRWKFMIAGLLFGAAIHTKMNLLIFTSVFLVVYLVFPGLSKKERSPITFKKRLFHVSVVLGVIFLLTRALLVPFPNLLVYTLYVHLDVSGGTGSLARNDIANIPRFFTESIPDLKNAPEILEDDGVLERFFALLRPEAVFVLLFMLISLVLFLRQKKSMLSSLTVFWFFTFFLVMISRYGLLDFRYYAPMFPFLSASLASSPHLFSRMASRRIFFWVVSIVIFSGLVTFHDDILANSSKVLEFRREFSSGLLLLPKNITVLTDTPSIFTEAGYTLSETDYDQFPAPLRHNGYNLDPNPLELLFRQGVVSDEWVKYDPEKFPLKDAQAIADRLFEHKYDVILVGTDEYNSKILSLIMKIKNLLNESNISYSDVLPYDSAVTLPTTQQGCALCKHASILYFKNEQAGEKMRVALYEHYERLFASLCEKDSVMTEHYIKNTVGWNRHPNKTIKDEWTLKKCSFRNELYKTSTGRGFINSRGDFILLLIVMMVGIFIFPLL